MKIYVDADGCPVVDVAISIAKIYGLDIIIVKNYAHQIEDDYAEIVSVDISTDSADLYIVNQIKRNDIVITQDYGLAALSLSKGAIAINQNGIIYTNKNMDQLLGQRHIHRELRRQGHFVGKARKRNSKQDKSFEIRLKELIKSRREEMYGSDHR